MFVFTTVLCIWLARVTWLAREQAKSVESLQAVGGRIAFDYQFEDEWKPNPEPRAPAWLRDAVGEDYFRRVTIVNLDEGSDPIDDDLAAFCRLPHVRQLTLDGRFRLTDACLEHFSGLRELRVLSLSRTRITGTGFRHIKALNRLEGLSAHHSPIADDSLRHIQNFTSLRFLILTHTNITDAGMPYLSGLLALESLQLTETSISDEGLQHLHSLTNLKRVLLPEVNVTEEGRARLQRALPNCKIR